MGIAHARFTGSSMVPTIPFSPVRGNGGTGLAVVPEFSSAEVTDAVNSFKLRNKASSSNGIASRIWSVIYDTRPSIVESTLNVYLRTGTFPEHWKRANLALLSKPGKPEGVPYSFRPTGLGRDHYSRPRSIWVYTWKTRGRCFHLHMALIKRYVRWIAWTDLCRMSRGRARGKDNMTGLEDSVAHTLVNYAAFNGKRAALARQIGEFVLGDLVSKIVESPSAWATMAKFTELCSANSKPCALGIIEGGLQH